MSYNSPQTSITYTTGVCSPFTNGTINTSSNWNYQYPAATCSIGVGNSVFDTSTVALSTALSFMDISGNKILTLNTDGTCDWAPGHTLDDQCKYFAKVFKISTELNANITKKVKEEIRDTIFEELIGLVKTYGALDEEKLRFINDSAKIVDKLKGSY